MKKRNPIITFSASQTSRHNRTLVQKLDGAKESARPLDAPSADLTKPVTGTGASADEVEEGPEYLISPMQSCLMRKFLHAKVRIDCTTNYPCSHSAIHSCLYA